MGKWVGEERHILVSQDFLQGTGGGQVCVHVQIIAPCPELNYGIHPCLSKTRQLRGTWRAQLVEHGTLDPEAVSLSLRLGIEVT